MMNAAQKEEMGSTRFTAQKQDPAILFCVEDYFWESHQMRLQHCSKVELKFRQQIYFITAITLNHRLSPTLRSFC